MNTANTSPSPTCWWGEYEVPEDRLRYWQIGPLQLWVERLTHEWRLVMQASNDLLANDVVTEVVDPREDLLELGQIRRFGTSHAGRSIRLRPMLADRAVVSRPETPFCIPSNEQVTVYVGTPIWVGVSTNGTQLHQTPTLRPSDTWLGPPTREGELCYASRTFCRLSLDRLHSRPHRATTAVTIANQTPEVLEIARLKLPVPNLNLYHDGSRLWTQDVLLKHDEVGDFVAMETLAAPPAQAPAATLIEPARVPESNNILVRAFSNLFAPG